MSHYIYLFSNTPTQSFTKESNIFHFTTELNKPLELEGEWEVALVEINYPKLIKVETLFFFVYTDIVDYTFVGSKQFPILRPALLKNSNSNFVTNLDNFVNPYYLPVNKKTIKSIEIQIEPDLVLDSKHFSMPSGDILCVLHLRRRK